MSKYKVMIGIPMHKGEVSAVTMTSVATASTKQHAMNFQVLGLSLLAKNFNLLFINAIKRGFDFFILHHSDLGVQGTITKYRNGSWLDLLVDRLLCSNLAALSSAVVIKSDNGFTSSGILTEQGDPYSLRRTTVKELDMLPAELITRSDLIRLYKLDPTEAGALLINSGLLIMDIRNQGGVWREKEWTGFNIHDEIAWNKDGWPESFTIPEDWNFSAWCHDHDVPYAFTRELVICHCGTKNYLNIGSWGDPADIVRQQMHPAKYRLSRGRPNNGPV